MLFVLALHRGYKRPQRIGPFVLINKMDLFVGVFLYVKIENKRQITQEERVALIKTVSRIIKNLKSFHDRKNFLNK